MPAPVELSCVTPDGATLVLAAATTVQMFTLETKTQLKTATLPEAPVFLKWVSPTVLGIVTGSSVFHWPLEGDAQPALAFARDASLAQSQIINYKVSSDGKWMLLNGLAAGPDGSPTGQLQLFSAEKGVSQPVRLRRSFESNFELKADQLSRLEISRMLTQPLRTGAGPLGRVRRHRGGRGTDVLLLRQGRRCWDL